MTRRKRILIGPLDWGLGHATRCISIVSALEDAGTEVLLGTAGDQKVLLQNEFPHLRQIDLPAYNIRYPKKGQMVVRMLRSMPRLLHTIKKERQVLEKWVKQEQIDAVISDNRFGLFHPDVYCIYMTHQVHIQAPVFEKRLYRMHLRYMERFHELWIPDFPDVPNLSGRLAHGEPMPERHTYIGCLSRFQGLKRKADPAIPLLVLLSGPEPQRSFFEKMLLDQSAAFPEGSMLLRGLPRETGAFKTPSHVQVMHHLNGRDLGRVLTNSQLVLSRPGYSTLMDLGVLGIPALFIPTPGQTEQEYLAKKLSDDGHYFSCPQKRFRLKEGLVQAAKYPGLKLDASPRLLRQAVDRLLQKI